MIHVWTCRECGTANQSNIFSPGVTTVKCRNLECLSDYAITTTTEMSLLFGGRTTLKDEDSTDSTTVNCRRYRDTARRVFSRMQS